MAVDKSLIAEEGSNLTFQAWDPDGESYRLLQFIYKNYKGEIAERVVIPVGHWYGSTEWHPKKQYLLKAFDVRKAAYRDFALNDILFWGSTGEWEASKNANA